MIDRLRSGDGVIRLLVAILVVVGETEAFTRDYRWHRWAVALVVAASVLPLLWRRRAPLLVSTLAYAGCLVILLLLA